MKLNNIVEKPIITEQSMADVHQGKYTFKVNTKASKKEIAQVVQRLFNVQVTNVTTRIMPGKQRRIGRTNKFTKTSSWKKAVVSLEEGQKIDLFEKK